MSDMVQSYMGTNQIYEDSDGNYVFSNQFTQDFYDGFSESSDYDVRVLNDFSNFDDYHLSPYTNGTFVSNVTILGPSLFPKYFINSKQYSSSINEITTIVFFFDFSDVAYIAPASNVSSVMALNFYDSAGNNISIDSMYFQCVYNAVSGTFTNNNARNHYNSFTTRPKNSNDNLYASDIFLQAPSYFWFSNHAVLLAKYVTDGIGYVKNQDNLQYYYDNSYSTFAPVSKDVINNNDWETIYNNYVNNVNENYNSDMTVDDLRDLMRQYTGVIQSAIDSGATDIMERVTTSNGWLRRIYERLGVIYDLLYGGGSGSGSGSGSGGSGTDYSTILGSINTVLGTISGHTASLDSTLLLVYAYLQQVRNNVNVDGYPLMDLENISHDLITLPTAEVGTVISKAQLFANAAASVSPLCFLAVIHHILEGLSADLPPGYAPSWTIPFRYQRDGFINLDYSITIDMAQFSSVHDILIIFECLAFIIFLIMWTYPLLAYMVTAFN